MKKEMIKEIVEQIDMQVRATAKLNSHHNYMKEEEIFEYIPDCEIQSDEDLENVLSEISEELEAIGYYESEGKYFLNV